MSTGTPAPAPTAAPGTERPRRYLPKLRYELIGCGLHGHELLGTDAAGLRPEDQLFARDAGGLRWYRCLRCDSWVVLTPPGPAAPAEIAAIGGEPRRPPAGQAADHPGGSVPGHNVVPLRPRRHSDDGTLH